METSRSRPKCPSEGQCTHYQDEHTAKGGCMHRRPNGGICGCTWTRGAAQGASPFGSVGRFSPNGVTPHESKHQLESENVMPTALWNIAGVAAELQVTPQAASAWHRGPEATPAPDFKVEGTNLELWTVDSIELWHTWLGKRNEAEAEKQAAKQLKKAATEVSIEVDVPSALDPETETAVEPGEAVGKHGRKGEAGAA